MCFRYKCLEEFYLGRDGNLEDTPMVSLLRELPEISIWQHIDSPR